MKILFIGDYSNLHACLAAGLRRKGHTVNVMSDRGAYMQTDADFYIPRQPGMAGGIRYLYRLFQLLPELKGYDVVQIINPNFLALRPGKIKYFFDRIRNQNGSMYLTLAGDDYYYVKACTTARLFRFSEFRIADQPTDFNLQRPEYAYAWTADVNRRLAEHIYEKVDGAMSVLPEYDLAARPVLGDRLAFTNLPIDLSCLPYSPLEIDGRLRLFIGLKSGMEVEKGTAYMARIATELAKEMPGKITVETVRDLSLKEYLARMSRSHLVLDQLYAYSPATNALQAMALGRVAASGAEPEYYQYIGEEVIRPVFHLSPLLPDLKERLRQLALDPSPLHEMSRQGRMLVEKHNDIALVADRFLKHWNR